jgi:hypothetical protein
MLPLGRENQVLQPYKTTNKIIFVYNLQVLGQETGSKHVAKSDVKLEYMITKLLLLLGARLLRVSIQTSVITDANCNTKTIDLCIFLS